VALPLSNSAEGGSDGTAATTGNTGGASGNAFDAVDASIVFDDDQVPAVADGVMAYDFGAPSATRNLSWRTASIGSVTSLWGRVYVYHSATPAEQHRIIRWYDSSTVECGRISWHTDAKVYGFDSTLVVPPASTWTITPSQVVRFEFRFVASTTVGVIEVKAFYGHSTTPIGTYTRTNVNTLSDFARVDFGNTVTAAPGQYWMDALQLNGTGYPGPVVSPPADSGGTRRMMLTGVG